MRRTLAICSCLALITLAAYWQAWGPPLYHAGLVGEAAADGSQPANPQYRNILCHSFNAVVDVLHLPTHELDYVYFDDPGYVTDNLHVKQGLTWESFRWAFTTLDQSNWHPLTWLSHMLDIELFGFKTVGQPAHVGPHMVNLVLHICNTLLIFLLLQWMTGAAWRSAMVAALFAVHPMHVESVAWVSERKDVLSTLLGLLTMAAYLWYVQCLKTTRDRPWTERLPLAAAWYMPTFVLFALCLLAKPMLVTLPCLLLLLDYWPLGRLDLPPGSPRPQAPPKKTLEMSRAARARLKDKQPPQPRPQWEEDLQRKFWRAFILVVEKLPLAALVAASCLATYYAQNKGGSVARPDYLAFDIRLNNALTAYSRYIGGMFWPFRLAAFYPYELKQDAWLVAGAYALLLLVTVAAIVFACFGRRYVIVGWLWFLGTLVPVIGLFVQVGDQSMADRYSYFTFTGLFIIVVWGAADLLGRWVSGRAVLAAYASVALAGCVVLTVIQVTRWQDIETAFRYTLALYPENPAYENNWGVLNWERAEGKQEPRAKTPAEAYNFRQEAIRHWRKATDIRRGFSDAWNNLGCAYRHREQGVDDAAYRRQLEEAVKCFGLAIAYKEIHSDAHSNMAITLWELNRPEESLQEFRKALQLRPDHPDANVSMAMVLRDQAEHFRSEGKKEEAARYLDEAAQHLEFIVHLDPHHGRAFMQLGFVRDEQGQAADAARMFNMAAWLMATSPLPSNRDGRLAADLANRANRITGGRQARVLDTLAAAAAELGQFPDAVRIAESAASMAAQQGDAALAEAIGARIDLYKAGRPFRDERHNVEVNVVGK